MTSAVLDTTVLASGFVGFAQPSSTPGQILQAWRSGLFQLVVSEHILGELQHTFEDPYFQRWLAPQQMTRAHALLTREAMLTSITVQVHGVATHPEDDLVLATALSAKVEYLVSGDRKLQRLGSYQGVTILSPRAFFRLLTEEQQGG